jgi:hypothetical protein
MGPVLKRSAPYTTSMVIGQAVKKSYAISVSTTSESLRLAIMRRACSFHVDLQKRRKFTSIMSFGFNAMRIMSPTE